MKYLLRIFDISGEDIAQYAGITRQAVSYGSKRVDEAAADLIAAARLDPEKMEAARKAKKEIDTFLGLHTGF